MEGDFHPALQSAGPGPLRHRLAGTEDGMMKKWTAIILAFAMMMTCISCGQRAQEEDGKEMNGQKEVSRIARYASELPDNYQWFDYEAAALAYDRLLFGEPGEGVYFPLMWQDTTHDTFGFAAYVGDGRAGRDGGQEAVATVASVLSATLLGVDKSSQDGNNYVAQLHAYFSPAEGVVLNNPGGSSQGASMWYMLYPAILFTQVSAYYPQEEQIREDALTTVESWYQAYRIMKETGAFDYTGFDFSVMQPYENGVWKEPDCAAGIAVLMQLGYEMTGRQEYGEAVTGCLDYLEEYEGSPLYEVLLYFAPSLAARMNARQGSDYNIDRLLADVLNGGSIPRGGWGCISGSWGEYCMNGLMGSTTDGGGYAFSMNTFAGGYALADLAKYDTRYARAMGIWYLNAAAAARYFFPGETAAEKQSSTGNEAAMEFIRISGQAVPFEGIRKSGNSQTPWVGGDPTVYGWAQTDLSLYSGAHTGMFAAVVESTDVEAILRIHCGGMTAGQQGYATCLLYNPHSQTKKVTYTLPEGKWDLFESVRKQVILEGVESSAVLELAPGEAAVIVELPAGTQITHGAGQYMAGDVWIASDTVTAQIRGLQNNDKVRGKVELDVRAVSTDPETVVSEIVLEIDGKETRYNAGEKVEFRAEEYGTGSKNVNVTVRMSDGRTDTTGIRLNFE